ncbi:MAG TPA: aminotransferase class V-fold PLP-dependent enzyme, partial [Fimbriimonas sp.]
MILFTPGPCMTSHSVRQAAAWPDMNHHDPEYLEIVRETKSRLLGIHRGARDWVPYLLGGSGTAAVEAMVASCIDAGPVLVVENGYYSARIRDILEVHGIPYEVFRLGWMEPWTSDAIDRLDQKMGEGYEALLATHNETTLGRLNPVDEIGRRCRKHGVRCLVDAMSSFGADDLAFGNIDAVASSANKCLHGIPGLSFVLLEPSFAEEVRRYRRRSYYLSLPMYEGDAPPLTPPVPALRAFLQALHEHPGQTVRQEQYGAKMEAVRAGLGRLGLDFAVKAAESSCTLCCPTLPAGWTVERWLKANRVQGFVLYTCKGNLRDRYFQVSAMGETTPGQFDRWLEVVRGLLDL